MDIEKIADNISVSPQIAAADIVEIKESGFRATICNRPDGEGADKTSFGEKEKAAPKAGLVASYPLIESGSVTEENVTNFGAVLKDLPRPLLAYCRSGTRSATLCSLGETQKHLLPVLLATTKAAGYDMNGVARRVANGGKMPTQTDHAMFDIAFVGVGAISTNSSLLHPQIESVPGRNFYRMK